MAFRNPLLEERIEMNDLFFSIFRELVNLVDQVIMLIGNKSDLASRRAVTTKEGEQVSSRAALRHMVAFAFSLRC